MSNLRIGREFLPGKHVSEILYVVMLLFFFYQQCFLEEQHISQIVIDSSCKTKSNEPKQ